MYTCNSGIMYMIAKTDYIAFLVPIEKIRPYYILLLYLSHLSRTLQKPFRSRLTQILSRGDLTCLTTP